MNTRGYIACKLTLRCLTCTYQAYQVRKCLLFLYRAGTQFNSLSADTDSEDSTVHFSQAFLTSQGLNQTIQDRLQYSMIEINLPVCTKYGVPAFQVCLVMYDAGVSINTVGHCWYNRVCLLVRWAGYLSAALLINAVGCPIMTKILNFMMQSWIGVRLWMNFTGKKFFSLEFC